MRWKRVISKLVRSPTTMTGLVIFGLFMVVALLAPILVEPNMPDPYRLKKDVFNPLLAPGSSGHVLGTDNMGSDILYGLVWGARLSISVAFTITLIAMAIGVLVGVVSGYLGGRVDNLLMRVTDAFFGVPPYILAMAILATLGATLGNLMTTLTIVFWPHFARVVRSQVLMLKGVPYVEAARALGAGSLRTILRHLLPNSLGPILVQGTLSLGEIVLWTAGLAFIGLAPADITEWGNMVSRGQQDLIGGHWWASFFPGVAIFLFVMSANLLGDGIRDLLDPRLQGR